MAFGKLRYGAQPRKQRRNTDALHLSEYSVCLRKTR